MNEEIQKAVESKINILLNEHLKKFQNYLHESYGMLLLEIAKETGLMFRADSKTAKSIMEEIVVTLRNEKMKSVERHTNFLLSSLSATMNDKSLKDFLGGNKPKDTSIIEKLQAIEKNLKNKLSKLESADSRAKLEEILKDIDMMCKG